MSVAGKDWHPKARPDTHARYCELSSLYDVLFQVPSVLVSAKCTCNISCTLIYCSMESLLHLRSWQKCQTIHFGPYIAKQCKKGVWQKTDGPNNYIYPIISLESSVYNSLVANKGRFVAYFDTDCLITSEEVRMLNISLKS